MRFGKIWSQQNLAIAPRFMYAIYWNKITPKFSWIRKNQTSYANTALRQFLLGWQMLGQMLFFNKENLLLTSISSVVEHQIESIKRNPAIVADNSGTKWYSKDGELR